MGLALRSPHPSGSQHAPCLGRCRLPDVQISSRPPIRESSVATSTRRSSALGEEAQTDCSRPLSLGMPVQGLGRLALLPRHCQTGDRDRLASQGLPTFLDVEGAARGAGASGGCETRLGTDPKTEPRESVVRSAAGSSTLASRLTPRPNGPPSNSATRFRGTPRQLSAAGSRSDLRRRIHEADQEYGHKGSPLGPAISVAAGVHRTPDRPSPPRNVWIT